VTRLVALATAAALLVGAQIPSAGGGAPASPEALERVLADDPCEFASRSLAVSGYHEKGEHALAYYHAAWLAWLGPGEFRAGLTGERFLLDREHRDRAAAQGGNELEAVLAAVAARRMVADSCLGGTIAQQASRLRKDIAAMLERAQTAAGAGGGVPFGSAPFGSARGEQGRRELRQRSDPVSRMALVELALSLDDAMVLEGGAGDPARLPVLRAAATGAETVAAWLPEAPGPHRTLAIIRARLADLGMGRQAGPDTRGELWRMAVAEGQRARQLDPSDPYLAELLWALCLRAGDWEQAAVWEGEVTLPPH
jgi:hypothetical protein